MMEGPLQSLSGMKAGVRTHVLESFLIRYQRISYKAYWGCASMWLGCLSSNHRVSVTELIKYVLGVRTHVVGIGRVRQVTVLPGWLMTAVAARAAHARQGGVRVVARGPRAALALQPLLAWLGVPVGLVGPIWR